MIVIRGILWSSNSIGIAINKMVEGDNEYMIDLADKTGKQLYSGIYSINREEAINRYGISVINKKGLKGVWVPLNDMRRIK